MKLVKPKAEILVQEPGLQGIYKQIELAGRTCYKSEDKITENSAEAFVSRMIKSCHTAMLEHGTVYLWNPVDDENFEITRDKYSANKYSEVRIQGQAITTNYRVLVENNWIDDLQYLCEPTEYHEKRTTFKLICDRGISHELVRHRVFSFAQESTRYCNYSKAKFGNELTFIKPSWYDKDEHTTWMFNGQIGASETAYLFLLEKGCSPQEARQILPNALKTELCMTGFDSDWEHFFDLRYFEKTGKVHPDMKQLTTLMYEEYSNRKN